MAKSFSFFEVFRSSPREEDKPIANPLRRRAPIEGVFGSELLGDRRRDPPVCVRLVSSGWHANARSMKRDMYKRYHKNRHKSSVVFFFPLLTWPKQKQKQKTKTIQHTHTSIQHPPLIRFCMSDKQTFLIDLRHKHLDTSTVFLYNPSRVKHVIL